MTKHNTLPKLITGPKRRFDPKNTNVFIVPPGDDFEGHIFSDRGFPVIKGVHAYNESQVADIMVWTGGEDIDPALYGEKPLVSTNFNPHRDAREMKFWREAYQLDRDTHSSEHIMKIGICRGGQFLNALNGGRMWQDINYHGGGESHHVLDHESGRLRNVSSTHHQQMIPSRDAVVVATTKMATRKYSEGVEWQRGTKNHADKEAIDYEVLWYPNTRTLCFQPHPEYTLPKDCEDYFFELIERYY